MLFHQLAKPVHRLTCRAWLFPALTSEFALLRWPFKIATGNFEER
jgi:hypothetical protein